MDDLKKSYKPELYEKIKNNGYKYAKIIIPELKKNFPIESVIDIGCGGGSFLHGCVDLGLEVFGVDGPHVEPALQVDSNRIRYANLEKPFIAGERFDLCVSMEVAEHLDEKYAEIFVSSLCAHSNNILFSAAQVGQPGIHHVNCQPLEYWIQKFQNRGYIFMKNLSGWIRGNNEIYNWYRKNSIVFRKNIDKTR